MECWNKQDRDNSELSMRCNLVGNDLNPAAPSTVQSSPLSTLLQLPTTMTAGKMALQRPFPQLPKWPPMAIPYTIKGHHRGAGNPQSVQCSLITQRDFCMQTQIFDTSASKKIALYSNHQQLPSQYPACKELLSHQRLSGIFGSDLLLPICPLP